MQFEKPTGKQDSSRKGKRNTRGKINDQEKQVDRKTENAQAGPSPNNSRTRRQPKTIKFVGRRISHQWIVDEHENKKEWYHGTVLSVVSGTDRILGAVYEVQYDDEDNAYEIDHLIEDYSRSEVEFIDV